MDGVFKLFNAITRIKKRVGLSLAMEKIVRFTRRKRREDKENHCEFNILDQKQKSRTVNNRNQLQLNKNTSTTFSFNNTGNQEEQLNYQSHARL